MLAKDLAEILMSHPDATITVIGDEMSDGTIAQVEYWTKENEYHIYLD